MSPRRTSGKLIAQQGPAKRNRPALLDYIPLFLFLVLVSFLYHVSLEKQTDYGFQRIDRLWRGKEGLRKSTETSAEVPALAAKLNLRPSDILTGQFVIDSYFRRLEAAGTNPWTRKFSFDYGEYRVYFGLDFFVYVFCSAVFCAMLYFRRSMLMAEELVQTETIKNQTVNQRLESKMQEGQKIIEKFNTLQGKLVESEKLASIGRLSATLAHEIRNPLTIIKSSTDIIGTEEGNDPGTASAVSLIRD